MVGPSPGYIHPNQAEQSYPQTTPWLHKGYMQTTMSSGVTPRQQPLEGTGR